MFKRVTCETTVCATKRKYSHIVLAIIEDNVASNADDGERFRIVDKARLRKGRATSTMQKSVRLHLLGLRDGSKLRMSIE